MVEAALLILAVLAFAAGAGVVAYAWRNLALRRRSLERLGEPEAGPAPIDARRPLPERSFLRRYRWVPWLVGLAAGLSLYFFAGAGVILSVAPAVIIGLLGGQLEALLAARRLVRIEVQLSDAIDLMVGALRGGAGVMSALENAVAESRRPLRPQLEEVLGRIRYGDDPQMVLRALVKRVPLETFQLFAAALSVHWEVGGSLAPTLANVGRTIRDRVELGRRIQSMTAESRASIAAVLLTTYFIGLIIWLSDPPRTQDFLRTTAGQAVVAAVVLLQAVGIVWSASVSRLRY